MPPIAQAPKLKAVPNRLRDTGYGTKSTPPSVPAEAVGDAVVAQAQEPVQTQAPAASQAPKRRRKQAQTPGPRRGSAQRILPRGNCHAICCHAIALGCIAMLAMPFSASKNVKCNGATRIIAWQLLSRAICEETRQGRLTGAIPTMSSSASEAPRTRMTTMAATTSVPSSERRGLN